MLQTPFKPQDPISLILASDSRLYKEGIIQDCVWELQYEGGELGGLSFYSTLGLQALSLRITPVFTNLNESRISLHQFSKQPLITSYFPNYSKINLEIFDGIYANLEYWVPNPFSTCGQVIIENNTEQIFKGSLIYVVSLKPLPGGEQMKGQQSEMNYSLSGKTNGIYPTFFLSGSTQPAKFGQSSIESGYEINPGEHQKFRWCLTYDDDPKRSQERISILLNQDFEKESSRIELFSERDVFQIETGKIEWDQLFIASQNSALQLLVRDPQNSQTTHLIQSRHPEKTIHQSDNHQKNTIEGISPLQLWYFMQVLPGQYLIAEEILLDFFNSQKENGFIGNSSNPANFQAHFLAFPILATITNEVLVRLNDVEKAKIYLKILLSYLKNWFPPSNDPDSPSIPHWENAIQSLYEELPIHNLWDASGNGIDTQWIESPFLFGLLLLECERCFEIADHFNIIFPEKEWLEQQKNTLHLYLEAAWNPHKKLYSYRDVITKKSLSSDSIFKCKGSGSFQIKKAIRTPQRLNIKLLTKANITRNITIEIRGSLGNEKVVEIIKPRQFTWSSTAAFTTTKNIYDQVLRIKIIHLPEGNSCEISTSNFSQIDLSIFIPLLSNKNSNHVNHMVNHWLQGEFFEPFGLPFVPRKYQSRERENQNLVDLPLNTLILEGLITNKNFDLANKIFNHLMAALIKNLQISKKFIKQYDASDGTCTGDYNIINGMIPLSIYLKLNGIHRWTENEIEICGAGIFKDEVKIQYRGVKVICSQRGHTIITPGERIFELFDKNYHKLKIPTYNRKDHQ